MSEELKRYDVYTNYGSQCGANLQVDEDASGDWVKYEDVKSQIDALSAELSQYKAHVEGLKSCIGEVTGNSFSITSLPDWWFSDAEKLLNQYPAISLAQVEAEAADNAIAGIFDMDYACETPNGDIAYSQSQIIEYANNLKDQG